MFKCSKCKQLKSREEFYKGVNPGGVSSYCKSCKKLWNLSRKALNAAYTNEYNKARKEKDELFKMKMYLRTHLWRAFKYSKLPKTLLTLEILGCSLQEFKKIIESKFLEGMTFFNYGEWEIDHIVPLKSAKNLEDVKRLCHHSNLRPLWKIDNMRKGGL